MKTNTFFAAVMPVFTAILVLCQGCAMFSGKDVPEAPVPLETNLLLTPVAVAEKYITPSQLPGNYTRIAIIDVNTFDKKKQLSVNVRIGSLQKNDLFFRAETETWKCKSANDVMKKLDPHIDMIPVVFVLSENGVLSGTAGEPSAMFISFLKDLGVAFAASDVEYAYLILPRLNILQ